MGTKKKPNEIAVYRDKIIGEICYALGVGRSGIRRRLLGPLFRRPAGRFGRIAARADAEVETAGISGGARRILPDLALTVGSRGKERIPQDGPLLLVSNHPGGLDSVAILSCIPRKDISVLISDVPFTRAFLAARRYFIYVPLGSASRLKALRDSIEHLQRGGALLIFANGEVEPDPEVSPGASESIRGWSRSVEIMLRRVPDSWLQVAIVSGALSRKSFRNPIVRIRKDPARRQKLAEVLQLSRQMVFPQSVPTHIHISFSKPVMGRELANKETMPALIKIACGLLEDHLESWQIPPFPGGPSLISSNLHFM